MAKRSASQLAVSVLGLLAPVVLGGCQAPQRVYAPDDTTPRCLEDARWWEKKAVRELEYAQLTDSMRIRLEHIDNAIRDLKIARDYYYDELLGLEHEATRERPVPFGRRAGLDAQIDRLERQIDLVYLHRPVAFIKKN